LIATINAKKDELPTKDANDQEIDGETALRLAAGDLVPTPLPPKRLRRRDYPKLLCEIVSNQFASASVNSGRSESFIKLFDIVYTDTTPMATVGGILASPNMVSAVQAIVDSNGWEGLVAQPISIPPLTVREKLALDRMMPCRNPPSDDEMEQAGFMLERAQIDAYHRHYLHYPMFGELLW
jgi:hypothetical protein